MQKYESRIAVVSQQYYEYTTGYQNILQIESNKGSDKSYQKMEKYLQIGTYFYSCLLPLFNLLQLSLYLNIVDQKQLNFQYIIHLTNITQQKMEPSTHNDQYIAYKNLLQRAKTYTHLIFYNRKLINQYQLASYGFRLGKSRDGHEQAKCIKCGVSLLLDPLIEVQTMQPKDNYHYAINKHEEYCEFNYKQRGHTKLMYLNRRSVTKFGSVLYSQIYEQNQARKQLVEAFSTKKLEIPNFIEKKYLKLLQNLSITNKFIVLLSIFGWKILHIGSVQCQYCGQIQSNSQQFDMIQSHRSACALIRQNYWEPILEKLTINNLQSIQGQFLKTEGQVHSKQLQKSLTEISSKAMTNLKDFKLRIKGIKSQLQGMSQTDSEIQKVQRNKFEHLGTLVEEIEECIKNGVKKVKIE